MQIPIEILMVEDSPMQATRLKLELEEHSYKAIVAYEHMLFQRVD
ncbi:MAG: hypothetical protein ACLP5H_05265 [Desulfomonilaceae bacterium]